MIEFLEPSKPDYEVYVNLICFEPAALRVPENDILFMGPKVREVFDTIYLNLQQDTSSLKTQILLNRFNKISMMLGLVKSYDEVVITKFLDKVWKRYAFFSNLGEVFIEIDHFAKFFPDYDKNDQGLYVQREIIEDADFDEESSDQDNNSSDELGSDSNNNAD